MDIKETDSPLCRKAARWLPYAIGAWVALMAVSLFTGWLDRLVITTWHGREGFDFFSVPRAFINLLHGQSIYLTKQCAYGPWATWYPYHPVLSVLAGSWLSLFSPWTAFGVFAAFSCGLLWLSGRMMALRAATPLLKQLSYFFMFCSTAAYLMLWNGQMHVFTVLAAALIAADLLDLAGGTQTRKLFGIRPLLAAGLLLTVFSKPVLLPAFLALFSIAEYRRTMIYSAALYALVSLAFLTVPFLNPAGLGFDALVDAALHPAHMYDQSIRAGQQFMTLKTEYMADNAIHWFNMANLVSGVDASGFEFFSVKSYLTQLSGVEIPKPITMLPVLLLAAGSLLNFRVKEKGKQACAALFLLMAAVTAFFVTYDRAYEYHYITALATVPAMLILAYQSPLKFSRGLAAFYCLCAVVILLPTPYYFLQNAAYGHHTRLFASQPDGYIPVWLAANPYESILPIIRPFRALPALGMFSAAIMLAFQVILSDLMDGQKEMEDTKTDLKWSMLLYFCGGALLLPLFWHQIDADGISYISIALRYIQGDFYGALNGYWGPLLSWLMIPLITLGADPLKAAKVVQFASGGVALCGLWLLADGFGLRGMARRVTMIAAAPMAWAFFMVAISPDLMATGFALLYMGLLWRWRREPSFRKGMALGTLGALAYLSKSYLLPFFIVHFSVFTAAQLYKLPEGRKTALAQFAGGLLLLAALSSPWIHALSGKYGGITVNTTGKYNMAVVGPDYIGHPMNWQGFFPPSDDSALSVWEDPAAIPVKTWSPFSNPLHQLKIILRNLGFTLWAFFSVSAFALLLPFMLAGMWKQDSSSRAYILFAIFSLTLYFAGYLPIVTRARYLYPCYFILLLLSMLAAEAVARKYRAETRLIIFAAIALSFLSAPAANLSQNINSGKQYPVMAKILSEKYGLSGNIASNENWMETLYVSYFLRSAGAPVRYFGEMRKGLPSGELAPELERLKIDYFLVWRNDRLAPDGWNELTDGNLKDLRIYRRGAIR